MGDHYYSIQYYEQTGGLTYFNVLADSETQAIVKFNNWVREQKRGAPLYDFNPKFGDIYEIKMVR